MTHLCKWKRADDVFLKLTNKNIFKKMLSIMILLITWVFHVVMVTRNKNYHAITLSEV